MRDFSSMVPAGNSSLDIPGDASRGNPNLGAASEYSKYTAKIPTPDQPIAALPAVLKSVSPSIPPDFSNFSKRLN